MKCDITACVRACARSPEHSEFPARRHPNSRHVSEGNGVGRDGVRIGSSPGTPGRSRTTETSFT
jgi:hypothetical protein